jgi:capsular polysaccharide transport system permease protein
MSLIENLSYLSRKSGRAMFVRTGRSTLALMLREMTATYGRTPGGYIWAIVEPIGVIALLSIAFSLIVRTPSIGDSFVVFYATGYLPFTLYGTTAQKTSSALRYSRTLLSYPSVLWIDAIISRFILNLITSATVFCIVMTAIIVFVDARIFLDVFPVVIGLALAACLGLGIGMVNCIMGGFFPVWDNIWGIISRPLFLASGVFFLLEDLPKSIQEILWWNPLIHVTGLVRSGFYATYEPSYVSLPYVWGVALTLILVGLVFLKSNYHKILEQ